MDIRLAAIDAAQKIGGCDDKEGLYQFLRSKTLDSEMRIGAYIALMKCPSTEVINTVQALLVNEEVNQGKRNYESCPTKMKRYKLTSLIVGSFIWTHLTNLQESQSHSPDKRLLKRLIGNDFLKNKWNTDARKFSRYFEASYFSKELNVGTTADGSVIFSQESYIPRSARLNLTFEVFGESLNLLEVGTRVEGFESAVEEFFGKEGYFRDDTFQKVLQGLRRDKRDSRSEIAGFQQVGYTTLRTFTQQV